MMFCAGFDLNEFAQPDLARTIRDSSRRYHLAVWGFAKPVIAAVNGAALGGGFDLALLCDLRSPLRRRNSPIPRSSSGPRRCSRRCSGSSVRASHAKLCLTGRRIDAAEAHRLGLVNTIPPTDSVLDEAKATARVIAEAPQAALEATKRYLASSAGVTFDEAFAVEHDRVFDEFLLGAFGPGPTT